MEVVDVVEVAPAARLEVLEAPGALVMPVEPVLVLVEQSVPEQEVEVEVE